MSAELKPCPFCGDKRVAIHYEHDPDGFGKFSIVRCHACGAQSQGVFASTGNDCPLHYEEVRDAWNRRATPAPGAPGQEAAAVQAVGAWQDIATAPKDGTWILLWEQYSTVPFVGRWSINSWSPSHEHVDAVGGWDGAVVVDNISMPVTHWQALPPPPSGAGEQP